MLRCGVSKECGQRNYKRSLMLLVAADPDERRARGTHSLAEDGHSRVADGPDLLELIGHAPRRSNLDSSTLLAARGEENRINASLFLLCRALVSDAQAGRWKSSPRLSTAQHMRAFLAAMATIARQYPRRAAKAIAH